MIGLALFGAVRRWPRSSGSATALIVCRAVMGIGGACISPASLSLLSNVFPTGNGPAPSASGPASPAVGVAVGPLAGGLLLEHFWWGSVFLVNVPIVAALICWRPGRFQNRSTPIPRFVDPLGCCCRS